MTKKYEKYKSSGVEWIGDIPEHWEVRKLKMICQVKRGASPRPIDSPKYFDDNGEFGWVRISDVTKSERYLEKTEQYLSKLGTQFSVKMYPNDIFLSIAGSVGKAIITKVNCCIHDGFVWFKKLNVNTDFLYYIFQISKIYEGLGKEGTQLNLNTETIGSILIPFVSHHEQQKIASYLDKKSEEINQFIKNKESLINLLEEEKKSIITKAVTKGLNKNVKLKDSGVEWLGEVPEHWEVTKLKYLTKKIVDGTHFTPNYINEGVPFLRITDLTSKEINLDLVRRISKEEHKELTKRCLPEKGDILLTKNGTIGVTKVIDWDYEFSIFVSICLIKFNQYLTAYYFEKFFKSFVVEEQLFSSSKVTSITNLHLDKIRELLIVFPQSIKEQQEIVAYLDKETQKIDDLKAKYRQEIDLIKEYKERLIYDVVTGKMNVLEH